jgi:SAM-dependent methyltransferase
VSFDASEERHSAAFFNPQRDFWWHDDYLRLLASRFGLGDVRTVLDVGSGVGHWGTLLLPLFSSDATLVGVERDPRWVADAERRASDLGVGHRCRYLQGVGEALPVEDESFDLVTCQTFLIHVADVEAVIRELVRALRPGGLLLVAEPNNLAGQAVADSITADLSTEQLTERFEFSLICERGKTALGEGDSSVGDLLPGYFARAGLRDVQTFLNDRTFELVPPYASPAQAALRDAMIENADMNRWGGQTEPEIKRYFLAGGGSEIDFTARWQHRLDGVREAAQRLIEGNLDTAGGGLHYVVAARRDPA